MRDDRRPVKPTRIPVGRSNRRSERYRLFVRARQNQPRRFSQTNGMSALTIISTIA